MINLNPTHPKKRAAVCIAAFFILAAMFAYGYVTVYRNCYNSMNETPMTVFDVTRHNGKTVVTLLNEVYTIG